MTNEKHISSWKERLNDLSAFPGDDVRGMEKSWEKLDARLHVKKERRQFRWYWIAAACMLLLVAVMLLRDDKKENFVQQTIQVNETIPSKKAIKQTASAESNAAIVTTPLPLAEKIKRPVTNKPVLAHSLPVIKNNSLSGQLTPMEPDTVNNIADVPLSIKQKPIVFTSLKKRLPMVHLNELEKPVPVVEAVAGNTDRRVFKLRFFNRDASGISPVSNDPGNNIITIKLPPQN